MDWTRKVNPVTVAGQQFDYAFDTIGNRLQTLAGGDATGANLRLVNYTNNILNQVIGRDVPGAVDVLGASILTNTVSVNGQTAYRKGEYFRQQITVNNTGTALWTNVTVSGGQTVNGNTYVAKQPEQFSYDADGNLTNDGRWAYTWDGENRLIQMTVNTNVGPQYLLKFAYDSKGRRIQKVVTTNGVAISTNNFLYDGWNLIAEVSPNNSAIRTYVWGSDLSGLIQGAGGVGGLLEMSYYGSATTNCFPAFDGNGNIAALINAANGTVVANYDYGAFGEPIRLTGVMARNNPFRFSTKYDDDESDLLYYGYRFYKPSTGTWPNRDPLDDLSFLQAQSKGKTWEVQKHLRKEAKLPSYLFVKNDPESKVDTFGLFGLPGGNTTEFSWNPSPCGKDSFTAFIQVGLGGSTFFPHPFVDDGTHGLMSDKPTCPPLYPNGGYPVTGNGDGNEFDDNAGNNVGKTWGLTGQKFEVCRVCLKPCCGANRTTRTTTPFTGYQIVSVGPCRIYTVTGAGGSIDLNDPGAAAQSDSASTDFNQTLSTAYPKALSGGCIQCNK